MALSSGARIGPYEVQSLLGSGGMGEVYRATDTNLKRPVAIKVLPAALAGDADRLARFQREAQVLAALNHPNIAAVYGLERTLDVTALVMELVEGEDLSALIATRPMTDALPIAKQIADALEAAHEQGIIHRDLKPQNIKVRADGTVKVLDFGLAKFSTESAERTEKDESAPATMTSPAMTAMGIILGTAAYMSPEQAKGRAVDKRADIWAFGVVLYEMLTGRLLFSGDSVAETIGFVATRDPDWTALPASTPAAVRRLLARCLTRDPRHRLRDIGEARIALADPIEDSPASTSALAPPSPRRARPVTIGLALAAVLMTAVAGYLALRPSPHPAPIRLEMVDAPTGGSAFSVPAVSPDGKVVAFAKGPAAASMIWLRPLTAKTAYPLAGTEGALQPFWSPDGSEIGFTAQGHVPSERRQIKKVPVGGGNAQTLAEVPFAAQGAWSQDGIIVVSQTGGAGTEEVLLRLPATGGTPTKLNEVRGSRWPSFLPDGRHFLFTVVSRDENAAGIYLGALDSTNATRLVNTVSSAQYADGHVFYVKDQAVVAQPIDVTAPRVTGDPVPLFEDVEFNPPIYRGAFSVAGATFVARARTGPPLRQLTWMSRSGAITGTLGEPGPFSAPDLSPDGKLVALIRANDTGGVSALWTVDLERSVFSELRAGTASVRFSSRGERIAYVALDGIRAAPIGGGAETVLLAAGAVRSGVANFPGSVSDWSPDDRYVSAQVLAESQILDVTAPGKPIPIGSRIEVAFSPAGGWMAYRSVVSGSQQSPVFVEPFTGKPPTGAGRIQVSPRGGQRPRWRQDGRELFYISGGEMMATTVTPGSPLKLGTPQRLFTVSAGSTYDVSADGQRFLLAVPVAEAVRPPFSVLLNWRALLPR